MTQESVSIDFRGTEEYRKMLQQEAQNRNLKVQELLEEAVARYLAGPVQLETEEAENSLGGPLTEEERRWLQALLVYLRDDTRPFKENILRIMAGAFRVDPTPNPKRERGKQPERGRPARFSPGTRPSGRHDAQHGGNRRGRNRRPPPRPRP